MYLDAPEWDVPLPPDVPSDPFGRSVSVHGHSDDAEYESRTQLTLRLFNSEVAVTCPSNMLKNSSFFECGAEASSDWVDEIRVGRQRVVITIDHGCCAGDVTGVATAMESLCRGVVPLLEPDQLVPVLLAGYVLGNHLAMRQCSIRMGQALNEESAVLALRCADFCGSTRLLRHCFYFLRHYFMTQGCDGALQLVDSKVFDRRTGVWAPTWPLTTVAMEYERRLDALGVYRTSPDVRQCYVHRIKKGDGQEARYSMHSEGADGEFMLSSHQVQRNNHCQSFVCKCVCCSSRLTCPFQVNARTHVISICRLEGGEISASNDSHVANVVSNFLGTEFQVLNVADCFICMCTFWCRLCFREWIDCL